LARDFDALIRDYLDWLSVERGLSRNTLAAYRRDLRRYEAWCAMSGLGPPEIAAADVSAHIAALSKGWDGSAPLAASSVARAVATLRGFHAFCADEGLLAEDPASLLVAPRLPQAIPKALDVAAVERLLGVVAGDEPHVLRDRALLEVLYGTGMRISEAVGLDLVDLDLDRRSVRAFGKGAKERIVPLGSYAADALDQWLVRARPGMLAKSRSGGRAAGDAVFLNRRGGRLTRQGAWGVLRHHAARASMEDRVSPHVLRHSCATHMLEGGADIRIVQEMLGHASIRTTQIYTRVSQQHLLEVYVSSHPRARRSAKAPT